MGRRGGDADVHHDLGYPGGMSAVNSGLAPLNRCSPAHTFRAARASVHFTVKRSAAVDGLAILITCTARTDRRPRCRTCRAAPDRLDGTPITEGSSESHCDSAVTFLVAPSE